MKSLVEHKSITVVDHQKTKIVATVGPACSSYENLLGLVKAGVDIFRLNFSHGSHEDHGAVMDHIQTINREFGLHIGILADLQGPKLRVGKIENNALELQEGDIITMTNEKCIGTMEKIYMSYPQFARDVEVGEEILVDDGKLVFKVIETNKKDIVKLKTLFGGVLSSNKGVNLPQTKISLPCLTEKDLKDLDYILTKPFINWIALSFVRSGKDMKDLRERIDAVGHNAKIIAKIEKPEAVEKIDKIIKNSNAIMVARGDLGIEVPMERLPIIQKAIINKCRQRARPVIVATQMMDSMITNPSPTRAEITDVANAVLDGTDAVMLSGETSVGKHPTKVVEAMNKIIAEAEDNYDLINFPKPSPKSRTYLSDVLCASATSAVKKTDAKAIIGMTSSGYTAFKVSSFRPNCQIHIFSDKPDMLATLNLVWGVRGFYYDKFTSTDETVEDVVGILKDKGLIATGDVLIHTGSMPLAKRHRTNMMRITVVE